MNIEQKNINGDMYTARLKITSVWNEGIDVRLRQAIHDAHEFEYYFGVSETQER